MAKYIVFKLKNMSPLHIGSGRENYDFSASQWQSDSISAALAAIRASQGKCEDIMDFLDSFAVSSAFPYFNDVLFLPKPIGKLPVVVSNQDEHIYRKKLKKIKFIEQSLWKELVAGKTIVVNSEQLQGDFLLSSNVSDFAVPMMSQVNQRVSVLRDNSGTEPFFFDWTYFRDNAGLYFIVKADGAVVGELKSLLEILGETGIGTDKNVGGGNFKVDDCELELDDQQNANASLLLSTYIPSEQEMAQLNLSNSKYELIQRDGFIAGSVECGFRHLRKKSVYMFNVGSVFKTTATLNGSIVDLRPDWNDEKMHPVYRSGKPFVIPVKINEDE